MKAALLAINSFAKKAIADVSKIAPHPTLYAISFEKAEIARGEFDLLASNPTIQTRCLAEGNNLIFNNIQTPFIWDIHFNKKTNQDVRRRQTLLVLDLRYAFTHLRADAKSSGAIYTVIYLSGPR